MVIGYVAAFQVTSQCGAQGGVVMALYGDETARNEGPLQGAAKNRGLKLQWMPDIEMSAEGDEPKRTKIREIVTLT